MANIINKLINNKAIYNNVPTFIKRFGRNFIPNYLFNEDIWKKNNPFLGTAFEKEGKFNDGITVGIIYDFAHCHVNYMNACHELKINYKVVTIHADRWIDEIEKSGCEIFFAWPCNYSTVWKTLYDERFYMLVNRLGKKIYPTLPELFVYESKKRVRDLLIIENILHPETHIFYTKKEALEFIQNCELPLVFKSDLGASSHGVEIVKTHKHAISLINKCFGKGYLVERADARDRRWGYIVFQKYLVVKNEWRITRVGDKYFTRLKHKKGDFFSGSGEITWTMPPDGLMTRTKELTDKIGFTSLAVDYFETEDGKFYVNELQALFGEHRVNTGVDDPGMGTFTFDGKNWNFQQGYNYHNACANHRIKWALEMYKL